MQLKKLMSALALVVLGACNSNPTGPTPVEDFAAPAATTAEATRAASSVDPYLKKHVDFFLEGDVVSATIRSPYNEDLGNVVLLVFNRGVNPQVLLASAGPVFVAGPVGNITELSVTLPRGSTCNLRLQIDLVLSPSVTPELANNQINPGQFIDYAEFDQAGCPKPPPPPPVCDEAHLELCPPPPPPTCETDQSLCPPPPPPTCETDPSLCPPPPPPTCETDPTLCPPPPPPPTCETDPSLCPPPPPPPTCETDPSLCPPPPPPPPPVCEVEDYNIQSWTNNRHRIKANVHVSGDGVWVLRLFATDALNEFPFRADYLKNQDSEVIVCKGQGELKVEYNWLGHSSTYWWFILYRDGVPVYIEPFVTHVN